MVKNIILDLGGVIINLDIPKTISEFNQLSALPFEHIYTQAEQSDLFSALDKGQISESDFFIELARLIQYQGPHDLLLKAWNAMLLDVPAHRLQLLLDLKNKYTTFLLSNTCEPHIFAFETELSRVHGILNFDAHFNKVYYSCRMGLRKPDCEIFERVLVENNLLPEETIFIDDSIQHVKGAASIGIQGHLLAKNRELSDLITELNL
jgi:putative hydrolase of the HAD superfamily